MYLNKFTRARFKRTVTWTVNVRADDGRWYAHELNCHRARDASRIASLIWFGCLCETVGVNLQRGDELHYHDVRYCPRMPETVTAAYGLDE